MNTPQFIDRFKLFTESRVAIASHGKVCTAPFRSLRSACTVPSHAHNWRTNEIVKVGVLFLTVAMLLGRCHLLAVGQEVTGTIAGTVKDTQGALVIGAAVTATNLDTGFSQSTVTNSDALYSLDHLPVGTYTVSIALKGFKTFVQKNVVLSVDQRLALNVAMEVGVVTQSVTVTVAPPLVNITTAELGRLVQREEITQLPLVNRDVYTEISLTAGVQSNSGGAMTSNAPNFIGGQPPAEDVVINGSIDAGVPMVSYYLDGAENMTAVRNYGNQLPTPDAIQEFRVETSDFSAEYGRMGAAVVTAVTRSGTNRFHGSLFEFNRNTDLNATPWNTKTKAPYHRNNFGGTVGGPLVRNKAFFFFSYGGLRQSTGQAISGGVLPTTAERTGDFSGAPVLPIDPTTGSVYDYNGVPGVIPPGALDPTAANIISKYIPLPNSSNNTWVGYFGAPVTSDEFLGKYDQAFANDHVSAEYFTIGDKEEAFGGGNFLYSYSHFTSRQHNALVSDVHTFSPRTSNQAWVTFTQAISTRLDAPAIDIGDLGSTFTIQGAPALPTLSVSGYFAADSADVGSPIGDANYAVRDLVDTIRGKHALAFGGEVSLDHIYTIGTINNFGIFDFSTSAPHTTGNALADFVTGTVASMEQDVPFSTLLSTFHYGLFLEDNYHLSGRTTLNLGLRYDIDTPPVQTHNLTQTFVPNVQSTVAPSAPLGLLYPGDSGVPRGIADIRLHHISPRIGIAWDPFGNGKTAVRAGAGVFYGSVSGNQWDQPAAAQPFSVRQTFLDIASLTNVYGDPGSFPNGDPFPYHYNPSNPRFLPNANVETISTKYQWPYTYQINFAVERQLPGSAKISAAYVGSLTHDMPFMTDANYPAYQAGATNSQASITSRRPYNDNGALGQVAYLESNQTTSYHALQITMEKQMSHNFSLSGFYVLSKNLESVDPSAVGIAGVQDFDALWEERGPTDYDMRNAASISGIWHPDYYSGSSRFIKQIANGWQISSIASLQSGLPVNIVTGTDNNYNGYSADRPNLVAGQRAFLNPRRSRIAAAAEWFNPAAFTQNGAGLGIGPGGADGNTQRNYLRAPGFRDIDLGVFRTFSLGEEVKLQLRGEATNAFNLVDLAAPNTNLSSPIVGKITSAVPNSYRQIQIGARLTF